MEIRFLGHASFLLTTEHGLKILLDPYEPGSFDGAVAHSPLKEKVDVLVSSHKHLDHFYVSPDFGNPEIVIQTKEAKGISFRAFPAAHDEKGGQQRGMVNMFRFEADGITFLHPGDIGEKLSGSRIDQIGKIDVMFLPVGGFFTIGPSEAAQFAEQINPKIIIPMHYKTQKIKFPIKPVDDFLKGKKNVKYLKSSRVTIKNESLPDEREIWVMEYEL